MDYMYDYIGKAKYGKIVLVHILGQTAKMITKERWC